MYENPGGPPLTPAADAYVWYLYNSNEKCSVWCNYSKQLKSILYQLFSEEKQKLFGEKFGLFGKLY